MISSVKKLFQQYKSAEFDKSKHIESFYLDHKNHAVVSIQLQGIEEAISPYSTESHPQLNDGLSAYINEVVYHIPLKYPIVLNFISPNFNVAQKALVKTAVTNYYGLMLEDKKQNLNINTIAVWGLLIVGVFLLSLSYFLSVTQQEQLITDIINIAGTFALWEMVDFILLDRRIKKIEKLNAAQILTAQVNFIN